MTIIAQNRWALGLALAGAAGSLSWFAFESLRGGAPIDEPARAVSPALAESEGTARTGEFRVTGERWDSPLPQAAGGGWIYEVFAPPELEFDARSSRFVAASMPSQNRPATQTGGDTRFGLALLGVNRAPFRLQLVGYAGASNARAGVFENQITGQVLLAGAGQRLPELELLVERVAVERQSLSSEHRATVQSVASAVIRDLRTGETHVLTDQTRVLTGVAVASVAPTEDQNTVSEVRAGDELVHGEVVFRIGNIQLAPPSLEVTKVGFRSRVSESRVLLLPSMASAGVAEPTL